MDPAACGVSGRAQTIRAWLPEAGGETRVMVVFLVVALLAFALL